MIDEIGTRIDHTDYSQPRNTVAMQAGDEPQASNYIEPRGIILEMQQYLRNKGLEQIRLDRWCWPGQTGNGQFAVELRSVLGEVRIAVLRPIGGQVNIDIRAVKHIQRAKNRLNTHLRESRGERWIRGKGWVSSA